MQDQQSLKGIVIGFIAFVLVVACGGVYLLQNSGILDEPPSPTAEEAASDVLPEEEPQTSFQWSAPMQRWFAKGNRVSVDFIHEDGWCAVAIITQPPETDAQPTVQCIK